MNYKACFGKIFASPIRSVLMHSIRKFYSSQPVCDELLKNVIDLIHEQKYDDARVMWATKVLQVPIGASYDFWASIEHVDMHELIFKESSICSSESCPKISQNRRKRLRQIPVSTNIQAELNLIFSEKFS